MIYLSQAERLDRLRNYVIFQLNLGSVRECSFKAIDGVVEAAVVTLNADGNPVTYRWSISADGRISLLN